MKLSAFKALANATACAYTGTMMTARDLFGEFMKLNEAEREEFMGRLTVWFDIHLPDTLDLPYPMKNFIQDSQRERRRG